MVSFLRYEHILMEPDPVPAYALKLLVAMTEHNPAFTRYWEASVVAAKGQGHCSVSHFVSLTLCWPKFTCFNPLLEFAPHGMGDTSN